MSGYPGINYEQGETWNKIAPDNVYQVKKKIRLSYGVNHFFFCYKRNNANV